MRLCPITEAVGEVLGNPIKQANGKLLLGAGFKISANVINRLEERGISHVYIEEEGTEDVVPMDIISDEVRLEAKMKFAGKIAEMKRNPKFQDITRDEALKFLDEGSLNKIQMVYEIRRVVEEMLKDITIASEKFLNSVMLKSEETCFIDHSVNVAVLSILMGRKYGFKKKELISLALGSFLHDIGKIVVDQIKGSDKPDMAESLYREHPVFGYMIVSKNSEISPMESQIVYQHHENQDRSGFPIGLKGNNQPPVQSPNSEGKGNIFRLAEICSVVDAFDNLVYNPSQDVQNGPETAIRKLIVDSGNMYNRDIVQTLLKTVPVYPVGATIKIKNIGDPHLIGHLGVVAKIAKANINKPVVILMKNRLKKKIKPIIVNTAEFSTVQLEVVL